MPGIDKNAIKESQSILEGNESIIFSFQTLHGRIYIQDDIVTLIVFYTQGDKLTFQSVFEELGFPEYQIRSITSTEVTRSLIYLLYPKKGYALVSSKTISDLKEQSFIREDYVDYINFFNPADFENLMTNGTIAAFDNKELKDRTELWHGFDR